MTALDEAHGAAAVALKPFAVEPYGYLAEVSAGRAALVAVTVAAPILIAEGRRQAALGTLIAPSPITAAEAEEIKARFRGTQGRPSMWVSADKWDAATEPAKAMGRWWHRLFRRNR